MNLTEHLIAIDNNLKAILAESNEALGEKSVEKLVDLPSAIGDITKENNSYLYQENDLSFYRVKAPVNVAVTLPIAQTTMGQMFRECNNMPSIAVKGKNTITSLYRAFYYCQCAKEIMFEADTSRCTNFESAFEYAEIATTIIGDLDFTSATNVSRCFFACTNLINVNFVEGTLNKTMTVPSNCLSEASKQSIVDGLATVPELQKLSLGNVTLTGDQINTVLNKGWSLSLNGQEVVL